MPTVNPRITITLPTHRHDLLKRLAALQGVSMASTVTELLEEFYPVLERVCVALEMAQQAQETSKAGIRDAADRAVEEMQPMLDTSMAQFDLFMTKIESGLSAAIETKSGASEAGLNPRVVTRGSGSQRHAPSKPVKSSTGKALRGVKSK